MVDPDAYLRCQASILYDLIIDLKNDNSSSFHIFCSSTQFATILRSSCNKMRRLATSLRKFKLKFGYAVVKRPIDEYMMYVELVSKTTLNNNITEKIMNSKYVLAQIMHIYTSTRYINAEMHHVSSSALNKLRPPWREHKVATSKLRCATKAKRKIRAAATSTRGPGHSSRIRQTRSGTHRREQMNMSVHKHIFTFPTRHAARAKVQSTSSDKTSIKLD